MQFLGKAVQLLAKIQLALLMQIVDPIKFFAALLGGGRTPSSNPGGCRVPNLVITNTMFALYSMAWIGFFPYTLDPLEHLFCSARSN